ncbi:DUF354 domain-containing protein [Methanococcoides methylutens]|uniref:DUF354 domain-containing protein n=1 Tax=Methanococcoides methylutens MM1 TaxID=1434104 RepID=A0A0E3WYL9_METMT|nr:DUF354 domain-containing protein [Methanococcoides methylutens]AKB84289.1 hypothetical protein MCMEM_0236 [Methanococcoides methylutens MM1]
MKILVSLSHPAHVHLFKYVIWDLQRKGHCVKIVARDKEICTNLLDIYNFDYTVISKVGNGLFGLGIEMFSRIKNLIPIIRSFNPDCIISLLDPSVSISAKICGKDLISFSDTEHCKIIIKLSLPFTDLILTPCCFKKDFGKKQVRYTGYHELAYLHPNYFTPNPEVLSELELKEGDPFIIMRFVSWGASHDVGHHGIQDKVKFVEELEKYGPVLITSEVQLESELEDYRIKVSSEKLHDLLYYASLCVGDGGTTAVESAILGTPSIYVSSLVGTMGNFSELEAKYGLLLNYNDSHLALEKAVKLMQKPNLKDEWTMKKAQLLNDKIDVTAFIIWFIENYPESLITMKRHPDTQYNFRVIE